MPSVTIAQHTVTTPVLEIAYEESGSPSGHPLILLHGFPYDIRQYDSVRDLLLSSNDSSDAQKYRILVPYLRGYGATRYLHDSTPRSGQQAAVAQDLLDFMDALSIPRAIVVGYDWGGRAGAIVSALNPERITGLLSCQGYSMQIISDAATVPPPPDKAHRHWYQYFFNTEIGAAGLETYRYDMGKMLWRLWSPDWKFTEEDYARTAKSFENPDYVRTVVHSYRHRYGYAPDDEALKTLEERVALKPKISVPTIVLHGANDGVEPPATSDEQRGLFTGYYERHILPNVGHCPPVEAPKEVVAAIQRLGQFISKSDTI